jgi:hypothetical protein
MSDYGNPVLFPADPRNHPDFAAVEAAALAASTARADAEEALDAAKAAEDKAWASYRVMLNLDARE